MPETITVNVTETSAEITPHLRWHKGVLQQGWVVTHYKAGVPFKRVTEWRDIPTEP
jgi:hypothetical protein